MAAAETHTGRRRFLVGLLSFLGGLSAIAASIPFLSAWAPSAKAKAAGSPVEVDISGLHPGELMTVEWRGRPVWILRRTNEMLNRLGQMRDKLRDPDSEVDQQPSFATNKFRSLEPEILVLIGICTHLGCVPSYKPSMGELGPEWVGGFYCPCHGSLFDLSGRVFKGVPAPINLEVPPYKFISKNKIIIGESLRNA